LAGFTPYDISADEVNIIKASEPTVHYQTVNVYTSQVNLFSQGSTAATTSQPFGNNPFFDYILGNPPFIGKHLQNDIQKEDMSLVFHNVDSIGVLDYVAAWYLKADQYIQNTNTQVAFVSTNSISQGEQVGVLWSLLFNYYQIKINFAHRTFKWTNEAKGNAAVHCVIIGFAFFEKQEKMIFEYEDSKGNPTERKVRTISPYLIEGGNQLVLSRSQPI
jgi:hypothetical protein